MKRFIVLMWSYCFPLWAMKAMNADRWYCKLENDPDGKWEVQIGIYVSKKSFDARKLVARTIVRAINDED